MDDLDQVAPAPIMMINEKQVDVVIGDGYTPILKPTPDAVADGSFLLSRTSGASMKHEEPASLICNVSTQTLRRIKVGILLPLAMMIFIIAVVVVVVVLGNENKSSGNDNSSPQQQQQQQQQKQEPQAIPVPTVNTTTNMVPKPTAPQTLNPTNDNVAARFATHLRLDGLFSYQLSNRV